ncbi:MAG: adenylosuccinate lyase [Synergistaceae bacterium]|nr:adenylosuccinate lyase [Synergistaceae bacterium]
MIPRYESKKIKEIWSDKNRFQRWLDVELATCKAWNEVGVIPDEDMNNISKKATFDIDKINEIETITQHDMIAFNSNVADSIGPSGRYIHLGLTSSDVIDTAASLLLSESLNVIIEELNILKKTIGKKASKYAYTPCAGRTHGIHAEPTTFGLKLLNHYAEIERDIERLNQAKNSISFGKLSGAVGTYANCPPYIETRVCELLGLKADPVATQVIQRDRHARIVSDIAICGASIERLALEIRHLQRTEVLEALEPFKKGQKGSSAMPHKKNPILCERLCGMSRLLRSYTGPAIENISLWHDRDISHSSVERVIWPDMFHLIYYMISTITNIISGLQINEGKMEENINLTNGLLFSGRVLLALVEKEGLSREDAYAIVQSNAMTSWNNNTSFLDLLKSDKRIKKLNKDELESLFELNYYFKHIEEIFSRFPELDKLEQIN